MSGGGPNEETLARLAAVLEARKGADASGSYVADLYAKGVDSVLKKIGEESAELILAGKAGSDAEVVHEAADLWFHSMVLLAMRGLGPAEVLAELDRRFGRSGLEEKASRG